MGRWFTQTEVTEWLGREAFASDHVGRIGVELEWLLREVSTGERPAAYRLAQVSELFEVPLPRGGALSFEAGGQLELSSQPMNSLSECVEALLEDASVMRAALDQLGLVVQGQGLDLAGAAELAMVTPRNQSLTKHYGRYGSDGTRLLCNAASVQVCLDAGDDSDGYRGIARRWWLANRLGPVLIAMFANSPSPEGWRSTREVLRFRSDPNRARPMKRLDNPRQAWADHVLDTTMLWPPSEDSCTPGPQTMREWLAASPARRLSEQDIRRHVQSMVPPVRARGYLEIRVIDAQPEPDGWVVPAAVVATLLDTAPASEAVTDVLSRAHDVVDCEAWLVASAQGLNDPVLSKTAAACMEIAIEGLTNQGLTGLAEIVDRFANRYTYQGRSPADD